MMVAVALLVVVFVIYVHSQTIVYDSSWSDGRSTHYTTPDAGSCGYGTIPSDSFPFRYIAGKYYKPLIYSLFWTNTTLT